MLTMTNETKRLNPCGRKMPGISVFHAGIGECTFHTIRRIEQYIHELGNEHSPQDAAEHREHGLARRVCNEELCEHDQQEDDAYEPIGRSSL